MCGCAGATVGKMPCLQISASTTAYGRSMIMHTRELVMSMFNKANGYEADCDVIYGDTDSVMVNFGVGGSIRVWGGWLGVWEHVQQGQRLRGGLRRHLWRHGLGHGQLWGGWLE